MKLGILLEPNELSLASYKASKKMAYNNNSAKICFSQKITTYLVTFLLLDPDKLSHLLPLITVHFSPDETTGLMLAAAQLEVAASSGPVQAS